MLLAKLEYDQNQNIVVPILIDTKESKSSVLNAVNIEANDDDDLVLSNVIDSKLEAIFGNLPSANKKETLVKNNIDLSCADPYIKISVSKGTVIRRENDKYIMSICKECRGIGRYENRAFRFCKGEPNNRLYRFSLYLSSRASSI